MNCLGLLSQVTSMMKHFSGDLNFLRESLRYLPSVQPHEVHSSVLVLLLFRDDDFLQVYCSELSPMEETFSCLPGAQQKSWRPLDRAIYEAKQSNQAGYIQAVVQESSCTETFPTHAGYLTCLGLEAVHRERVNYQGMRFYPCCTLHSREGAEFCFHLDASYEFYLEKTALVEKMENSGSNNFILSIITPLVHSSNTCSFGNILMLAWRSQGLSMEQLHEATPSYAILVLNWPSSLARYKPCVSFLDNKYVVVIQLLAQLISDLIGKVHKRGMQPNAVESKEYKSNSYLYFPIHLVELEQGTYLSSNGVKTGMYLLCASTNSMALVVLLLEWQLSSCREFLVGAIIVSISVTCTAHLYSTGGTIFIFSWRMQLWFCVIIGNWIECCPFLQLTSEEGGKCPVLIVVFTSTSENAEVQSIMIHVKKSVHWQFRRQEKLEDSGTCTSDSMVTEGKEVIITVLFAIIYCSRTVQRSAERVTKYEPWCFYHPFHSYPTTSTEAWEQYVCQHLISARTYHLLSDYMIEQIIPADLLVLFSCLMAPHVCKPNWLLPTAPFLYEPQLLGYTSLIGSGFSQGVPCDWLLYCCLCSLC